MKTYLEVTIIMATFNRAHFIAETLLSVQNQTFKNWECLIIDDGGTDNTKDIIAPFIDGDDRFRFFIRPPLYTKGLPGCRNYGLDLSKGTSIIFFDDDDIVHPLNLELCVEALDKTQLDFCRYERAVFMGAFNYKFDLSKQYSSFYIDRTAIASILNNQLPFNSCAVLWKKLCFQDQRFDETLMFAEEWELYSRIIMTGLKGVSIEKCLFYGRKHDKSNTGEYYLNNPIRRNSHAEAVVLVMVNLRKESLLTDTLVRYLVVQSYYLRECNSFPKLIDATHFSGIQKVKWQIFYKMLPLRLSITRFKVKIRNLLRI